MPEAQPLGRYLLNYYLPDDMHIKGPMGKKELNAEMNKLAKRDPRGYVKTITGLKKMGDKLATLEGLSVGLDDITPEYAKRDAALKPVYDQFKQTTSDKRRRELADKAQEALLGITMSHKGSMTQQVRSGARGNPVQYMGIVAGPGAARDAAGRTEPWIIRNSYSEGLKPSDYWVAGNEAILNTIKSSTSVSEPGELSKILVANMADLIVTEDDCGTDNGILLDPSSPDVIDRYLAKDAGTFRANTLITPLVQAKLAKLRSKVLVRSPMTCEAGDGVCQKCQGLDEKGNIHEVGTNVGVRSAQALADPLTQMALDAKHGVRTAKGERMKLQGLAGFRQMIESPKQFLNKATLATVDGKVTNIEKAPQGGHYIHVDGVQHYTAPNLNPIVKKGVKVERGDALGQGIPKPDEVVKYKGLGVGREYMVNSLKDLYQAQGRNMDQRHFELLARGELNNVRIMDDSSDDFIKGDIVNYNHLRKQIKKDAKLVPISDALGETLGKEYLSYSAGMRVTPTIQKDLQSKGVTSVLIAPRVPEVEFVMKPASRAPLLHPDWMARLAHRNLKATLQQAAHFGDISNLHGAHPVPAYVFGETFGQGEEGRY